MKYKQQLKAVEWSVINGTSIPMPLKPRTILEERTEGTKDSGEKRGIGKNYLPEVWVNPAAAKLPRGIKQKELCSAAFLTGTSAPQKAGDSWGSGKAGHRAACFWDSASPSSLAWCAACAPLVFASWEELRACFTMPSKNNDLIFSFFFFQFLGCNPGPPSNAQPALYS